MSDLQQNVFFEQATFGTGCFWGAEASFRALSGVLASRVGFARSARDESALIEVVQVDCRTRNQAASILQLIFFRYHDVRSKTSVVRPL